MLAFETLARIVYNYKPKGQGQDIQSLGFSQQQPVSILVYFCPTLHMYNYVYICVNLFELGLCYIFSSVSSFHLTLSHLNLALILNVI